jgi:hypothetical protein
MSIKTLRAGYVRLTYFIASEVCGGEVEAVEEVERDFCVSGERSYVWEWVGDDTKQVCEHLDRIGPTLLCKSVNLEAVIKREFEAMKRAEAALRRSIPGHTDHYEQGHWVSSRHPVVREYQAEHAERA